MDHLRYAGLPFERQRQVFLEIIMADQIVREALARARALGLPDWFVVSGALYNSIWNSLTGKPSGYGIKDIDLFYFDAADLSYEAEDAVIAATAPAFAGLPVPVEIRNQARVHLWFHAKFGRDCPRYTSCEQLRAFDPPLRVEDARGRRAAGGRWQRHAIRAVRPRRQLRVSRDAEQGDGQSRDT
jgi:hypothetical protein